MKAHRALWEKKERKVILNSFNSSLEPGSQGPIIIPLHSVLIDLKASVRDVSVDLDTNCSLKPRALRCNILLVSLDFWQALVYFSLSLRHKELKFESTAVPWNLKFKKLLEVIFFLSTTALKNRI